MYTVSLNKIYKRCDYFINKIGKICYKTFRYNFNVKTNSNALDKMLQAVENL